MMSEKPSVWFAAVMPPLSHVESTIKTTRLYDVSVEFRQYASILNKAYLSAVVTDVR